MLLASFAEMVRGREAGGYHVPGRVDGGGDED